MSCLLIKLFITLQLNGQSDKEIADEYFVKNSEVRQAQVSMLFPSTIPLVSCASPSYSYIWVQKGPGHETTIPHVHAQRCFIVYI